MATNREPTVAGFDRTGHGVERIDHWAAVARDTLVGEGIDVGQVDLIFVDPDEMAELNETHMGHDGPTDVLSFPLDADGGGDGDPTLEDLQFDDLHFDDLPPEIGEQAEPASIHLGDIVVCAQVAEQQAPQHCGTVESELSLLVIHGVLHILGHDHAEPDETSIMQQRERFHLARYGFDHPEPNP